jgi:hypothetical protein
MCRESRHLTTFGLCHECLTWPRLPKCRRFVNLILYVTLLVPTKILHDVTSMLNLSFYTQIIRSSSPIIALPVRQDESFRAEIS